MLGNLIHKATDKLLLAMRFGILFGIVGLIVGGGWYIMSHTLPMKKQRGWENTDPSRDEKIQGRIKEFKMTEQTASEDKWNLTADVVYMKQSVKEMETVQMKYHPAVKWGMPMEMNARKAVLRNATSDIAFSGDVTVTTYGDQPMTLRSDTFFWSQGKRQLTSDEVIRLETRGAIITGRGLVVDMERKTFTVLNSVQAVF